MSDEHETNVLDYDGCDCDGQTNMAVWVRLCVPGGADPWRNTCPWACPMARGVCMQKAMEKAAVWAAGARLGLMEG